MNVDPFLLLFLVAIVAAPFILIFGIRRIKRNSQLSRAKRMLAILALSFLMVPFAVFFGMLLWIAFLNFPFSSSVVVQSKGPTGEEVCVVQISDIYEYSVGLYARRMGQPWVWHFIDGDDYRWRHARVEFVGDEVRVYNGSTLRRTIVRSKITVDESDGNRQFPANYTPQQIVEARGDPRAVTAKGRK